MIAWHTPLDTRQRKAVQQYDAERNVKQNNANNSCMGDRYFATTCSYISHIQAILAVLKHHISLAL